MKLVTFHAGDRRSLPGAVLGEGERVVNLAAASEGKIGSIQSLIEMGDTGLELAERCIKDATGSSILVRSDVRLTAPIQPPIQMRDFLCFETHLRQAFPAARKLRAQQFDDPAAAEAEMERKGILSIPDAFYEQPIYYKANRFSCVGHEDDVLWPEISSFMDFELELGFYIGRKIKDVKREDALENIFGYTVFNDFTARDVQTAEMGGQLGPAKGKDFDTANAMGPWLVTADEFGDPYNKDMICRVNGEEWGRGSTATAYWKFEDLLAHVTASETLYPGEFIGSGTVGNGCGLEHMRFLTPGDVIELEIEGIGVLRNRIVKADG
ncbi:MAG: fumarylacetoacetate hydrolase family protein [Pseudomonadota bacterium]